MADIDDYTPPSSAPDPPGESRTAEFSPPANIQAELVILGAALLDAKFLDEAAELIEDSDFFLDSSQRIFRCMLALRDANRPIDLVTLSEELSRTKEIEAVGGVAYLASLTEGLPRRPVIADYVRSVKDKALMRRLMSICTAAIARAADQSETALEIVEATEAQLLDVAQDSNYGKLRTVAESVALKGGVDQFMAPILNPVEMTGIRTGFYDYDAITGGLQKAELIVIAARPSMGKTALAMNIVTNIALTTENVVAVFSLEMSRDSIERRLLASVGGVDVRRAMSGQYLSGLEKDKLQDALGKLVESRIFIDDSSALTPTQMRAKARRLKQRHGRLDLAVIDYAQLMTIGRHDQGVKYSNRQEEVAAISRALKAMAKELDVPVLALAQLNRGSEGRADKRPILADLRESGQIEQDADVVTFIHRQQYYEPDNEEVRGIADLIVAKQRSGPTGVVKVAYISEFTRFGNLAIR